MILENDWDPSTLETMIGKSFFDLTLPFPWKNGEISSYRLKDTTFEIDNKFITNRPDLFSVVGNAREFHAVFEVPFDPYNPKIEEIDGWLTTEIQTQKVLSYHLMKMENIEVGKSPYGISLMMERAGLSPKMDIVDITNLIMTELGQPMHAFDADKITGNISVRMAKNGEKILALNGSEYTLTEDDMIIADDAGPIAIAWVIGGMESAVSEWTKNIIWESACFDSTSVRLTAQRHGIRTDASTRYEKSLDPILAGTSFPRVIEYMKFLGKNISISGSSHYIDEAQVNHNEITVEYNFINTKIGFPVAPENIQAILSRLGFVWKDTGTTIHITVPSWRASKDVSIKEDIVEEISRVIGYGNIPSLPLPLGHSIIAKNFDSTLRDITLDHLKNAWWNEVYTYSFTSKNLDQKARLDDIENAIAIKNAFNEEYTHMRRSLAPRLFMAAWENLKYAEEFGFFEIGKVYTKNSTQTNHSPFLSTIDIKPFPEKKIIAWVLIGKELESLRKTLESYLKKTLGYLPPVHTGTSLPLIHPGISGTYREEDTLLAQFWVIHPEVAHAFHIPENTLYFEIDFREIEERYKNKDTRFHTISRYQTIPRELNFILEKHTPTGDVARIIDSIHPWITDVYVDSVFEDEIKVGKDKKSVNFAFTLSNHEATISDEDALHVQNSIIEKNVSSWICSSGNLGEKLFAVFTIFWYHIFMSESIWTSSIEYTYSDKRMNELIAEVEAYMKLPSEVIEKNSLGHLYICSAMLIMARWEKVEIRISSTP